MLSRRAIGAASTPVPQERAMKVSITYCGM
jgi:hypothetical protein